MDMNGPEPHDEGARRRRKPIPKLTKKKLDRFLSSLCEAAGMTGRPPARRKEKEEARSGSGLVCRGPCRRAQWRAHLDIPSGILCVSADWSKNRQAEKHRDVTVAITFEGARGKSDYMDMVFCDSEVRWLMETLWHAPIWDH
jgi:hypothetical protein